MKTLFCITGVLLAVTVLLPFMAHANSMTYVDYESTGYRFDRVVDGRASSANTGILHTVMRDDQGALINNGEWFTTLCVEPGTRISRGDTLWASVAPEEFNNGAGLKAAWLFDSFYKDTTSHVELAGLQLAMWEVVKDDSHNLSTGNFQVTFGDGTAINYAKECLADLETSFDVADTEQLNREYTVFVGDGIQDLIVKTGDPVPEPGTMLLLGSGLLGVVGIGRKRLKK